MVLILKRSPLAVPEEEKYATCDGTKGNYANDNASGDASFVWATGWSIGMGCGDDCLFSGGLAWCGHNNCAGFGDHRWWFFLSWRRRWRSGRY